MKLLVYVLFVPCMLASSLNAMESQVIQKQKVLQNLESIETELTVASSAFEKLSSLWRNVESEYVIVSKTLEQVQVLMSNLRYAQCATPSDDEQLCDQTEKILNIVGSIKQKCTEDVGIMNDASTAFDVFKTNLDLIFQSLKQQKFHAEVFDLMQKEEKLRQRMQGLFFTMAKINFPALSSQAVLVAEEAKAFKAICRQSVSRALATSPLFALRFQEDPVLTISNSFLPMYMRLRTGHDNDITVYRVEKPDIEYPINDNDETFLFKKNQKIVLPLSSLSFPLRLRVWTVDKAPTADTDAEGKSVGTSKENKEACAWCLYIKDLVHLNKLTSNRLLIDLYQDDHQKVSYRSLSPNVVGYVLMEMRKQNRAQ